MTGGDESLVFCKLPMGLLFYFFSAGPRSPIYGAGAFVRGVFVLSC